MTIKLSIIVPALNEASHIEATLLPLQPWRQQGIEILVVDGGSDDATLEIAEPLVDRVINTTPGRARQMNAGAKQARGKTLLFLHADTLLPGNALELIEKALETNAWGHFYVRLSGSHPLLRVVEAMMNWRSRLSGIATGDQAIFIQRQQFEKLGGYSDIPLMEDIDISRRLKHHGRPACIKQPLITSSRRWEENGILKTILLMWRLRLAYFMGASPDQLARQYR